MKLLRLRVDFEENARPVDADSGMDEQNLNAFRVPFRLSPKGQDKNGTLILLQGDLNMNSETQQWYGMYGFVARVLEEASSTAKKRLGLKKSSSKK